MYFLCVKTSLADQRSGRMEDRWQPTMLAGKGDQAWKQVYCAHAQSAMTLAMLADHWRSLESVHVVFLCVLTSLADQRSGRIEDRWQPTKLAGKGDQAWKQVYCAHAQSAMTLAMLADRWRSLESVHVVLVFLCVLTSLADQRSHTEEWWGVSRSLAIVGERSCSISMCFDIVG